MGSSGMYMRKENYMRAYLEICKKSFQERMAYRGELLIRFVGIFMSFYLLYMFWKALYANSTDVQGISFHSMITYTIMSAIMGGIINIFGILNVYLAYWMSSRVRTGEIVMDMMKPTDFQLYLFSHSFGRLLFNVIVSVPIFILAIFIFKIYLPDSLAVLALFAVSLSMSYLLTFLIDFMVSLVSFWTTQNQGVGGFTRLIIALLSGAFIPLWFFPEWARNILSYFPFASIYHVPLSIYIGKIKSIEGFRAISLQLIWIGALYAGSRLLWLKSRRKLMTHGG